MCDSEQAERKLASRRVVMAVVFVVLALVGTTGPRPSRAQEIHARNIVYVESNDPSGNAIFAFSRSPNGQLNPLPGSPYSAGGLGITPTFALGPFDSDQNVIVGNVGKHQFLFAVNGGSDTIAVFRINPDGSLMPVPGSPFPSGGSNPVSVGLTPDGILGVVNKDQDPGNPGQFLPNYTSFRVTPQGRMIPVPRSVITVDAGSSPSQALISPSGRLLFGADFMGELVRSFQIAPSGRLVPADAVSPPAALFQPSGAPPFPLGLAAHPTRPLLYVGLVTINRLGVYHYDHGGGLRFVQSVPNSGTAICWLLVNKNATRLYTSNTGDPSISVYDLTRDPSTPVEIQKVILRSNGNCFQFALDSSEQFLHVVTQQSAPTQDVSANAINVLKVDHNGMLTEVPTSPILLPVPNLVRPQGVAAL